jgi:hypothetical protein
VDEEQKAKLIEEGGQLTADESKCLRCLMVLFS